jgi:hypothetical protein
MWFVCLVMFIFIPAGIARAVDLPPTETPDTPVTPKHVAVDGSVVATSLGSGTVDFGGTFAPFGDIDNSGFRLHVGSSYSWYKFITDENPRTFGKGYTLDGDFMAGYEISLERISIIGLIGPNVAEAGSDDGRTTRVGAKTEISMYANPTDQTMAYGSVAYSTIENQVQLQSKFGLKLANAFYLGPEATFSWRQALPSSDFIGQQRIGVHLTAVGFGPIQMIVSGGWAHQQELGSGYYGGLGFYWPF